MREPATTSCPAQPVHMLVEIRIHITPLAQSWYDGRLQTAIFTLLTSKAASGARPGPSWRAAHAPATAIALRRAAPVGRDAIVTSASGSPMRHAAEWAGQGVPLRRGAAAGSGRARLAAAAGWPASTVAGCCSSCCRLSGRRRHQQLLLLVGCQAATELLATQAAAALPKGRQSQRAPKRPWRPCLRCRHACAAADT
jgi:hypothetical protein